jgi:hypothetical protein
LLARLILYCFVIQDFREHNTDTKVHFELTLSEENMAIALAEGLVKKFKLTTTISTSNMHLFDSKGIIKKYDTPEQSMTHVVPCKRVGHVCVIFPGEDLLASFKSYRIQLI